MNNDKIKYSTVRATSLLMLMLSVSFTGMARINSDKLKGMESSGFNGFEHVLQKPLGNPSFPDDERSFGRHIFLGFNAGGSILGNSISGQTKPGFSLGGRLGGWITPVHGIRVGADFGLHSVQSGAKNAWYGSAHAEYLLNLTTLLRGYDPTRHFELIGTAGLLFQRTRQNAIWGNNYGASTSLQMRFNVAPSLYLYLEPQLAMLAGMRYDTPLSWYRMNVDLSLNLGIGYRILTGRYRKIGSTKFIQQDDDNLYFGAGAGLFGFAKSNMKVKNPLARVFVGKMFSSTSGLQLGVDFGQYRPGNNQKNKYTSIGSLDYVLNLNNAFGGYRPDETFQMLFNTGASVGMARASSGYDFYPGVQAGLTGIFRLSSNWGIFFHPQVSAFSRGYTSAFGRGRAPFVTLDLGLRYTIGDFTRLHRDTFKDYDEASHWFLNMGVGGAKRFRGDYGLGGNVFFGLGKRFTPVSSWRVNFEGNLFPKEPHTIDATLHADYLSSITTAMMGYDPKRVFDLQLVLGAFGGVANYSGPNIVTYGLTGGMQANFRLSNALDLYIEPQIQASYGPAAHNSKKWTPDARVLLGLRYKLGTKPGQRGKIEDTPYGDYRNFAGISIGPSVFGFNISEMNKTLGGLVDLNVGRWFSMVSGLRAVYSNEWIKNYGKTEYMGSLHLDYMLNFTSLMNRSSDRRFHIIGVAGGGIGFCGTEKNTKPGIMAAAGVQFRYNLPANIDIHIEPGVQLWANKALPISGTPHNFGMTTRISAGASYRF